MKSMQPNSQQQSGSGNLFIVSAPSGAGKTTLCKAALERLEDLYYSVSHTTRAPRPGECDGIDYHFTSIEAFERKIAQNKWAEWAEIYGNYYGTCSEMLDRQLARGRDILLDIDVQGTRQILRGYPESVTIFILPPSLEELKERLRSRGTDKAEVIAQRLAAAEAEIKRKDLYRHVIVNDHLTRAIRELVAIIEGYRAG